MYLFIIVKINDLKIPVPETKPIVDGQLVYSKGGKAADGFYFWNQNQWQQVLSLINPAHHLVVVSSVSDFPKARNGIITLASNSVYLIQGTVLVSDKINLNGSNIIGSDKLKDKLVYVGATAELFTGSKGGCFFNLTLSSPVTGTKLFNLKGAGAPQFVITQNIVVTHCYDVGFIKGFRGKVFFSTTSFADNRNDVCMNNISGI